MLTEIDPHAIGPDDEQARIPATVPAGESLPLPAREVAAAADYARAEKAAATRRAYRSDFEIFHAWCAERYVSAIPASPESVAAFLAHEADQAFDHRPPRCCDPLCAQAGRLARAD
jgi:hypothetical protein